MAENQRSRNASNPEHMIGRTLQNGTYTIQRVLGHGGMGKVYLATHKTLQTQLAIKQARADQPLPESVVAELDHLLYSNDPDRYNAAYKNSENVFPISGGLHTDRFLREALLLARLEHFAIPALYDYFAEDGYWYLVMDYVPGPTLDAYLRQHTPLPPLLALNYAMHLCEVLDYLHHQTPPVIFRDLKPSNVILAPDGTLTLIDFGIARYFKTGQINDTTDFGSPGYASPEQYSGEGQTDARSDLYSLGVVLHEMLTGKHPKGSSTLFESPRQVNPALSAAICGLVALATHAEPARRIQSARVFYLAMERVYEIEEQLTSLRAVEQFYELEQLATTQVKSAEHNTAPSHIDKPQDSEPQTIARDMFTDEEGQLTIEDEQSPSPAWTARFDQRQQIRQMLGQSHQQQHEKSSTMPTARDLKRRSSSITQTHPSQSVDTEQQKNQISSHNSHCALQISLSLVLALLLSLGSHVIYQYYFARHAASTSSRSVQLSSSGVGTAWHALAALPEPEADNSAVYVQFQGRPYIYMLGGYRSQRQTPDYDHNLYRYDVLAAHWETLNSPHLPGTLNNAMVTDEQGHLFFTAGYSTDTYTVVSALYIYQIATNSVRKIIPPAQISIGFGGSMLADQQGHLYITQGFMTAGHPETRASTGWYRYDIASQQWHRLAALPQGLGYTLLVRDNDGSIFLFGGSNDAGQQQQSQQIYRYNTLGDSWQTMQASLPQPLSGVASCEISAGQIIAIGGYGNTVQSGPTQARQVNLYDMHWQTLPIPPFGHAEMGNALCDNNGHVFVERGSDATHRPTVDFWELNLSGQRTRL
jgi:serine/threonine protein kinase